MNRHEKDHHINLSKLICTYQHDLVVNLDLVIIINKVTNIVTNYLIGK
jgi:hypothetical protein